MRESSLHHALKEVYSNSESRQEAWVDGFLVDIHNENQLVEIQTGSFHKIKPKLEALLTTHPVLLVHPIASEKWICRVDGDLVKRRRSPRKGIFEDVYHHLVSFPNLITDENFSLEVVFIQVEEIWMNDNRGSWRRKGWSIVEKRLLGIQDRIRITNPADLAKRLPDGLVVPFTVRDLAEAARIPLRLAYRMTYCLREVGVFQSAGKRSRTSLYRCDW